MKKGWIIGILIALLLLVGIVAGIYVHQKNQTPNGNFVQNKELAQESKEKEENNNLAISTSTIEEKISPSSKLIQKQYFKGCDHLIRSIKDIPEELVNSTEQEIERTYPDWKIEKFSKDEIVIYQEKEGFCNQHYKVKEHNGVLGIFTIDENGNETLKEDTEIETQYLPEIDLQKVKEGIEAMGDEQLHSILEDFE